MNVKVGVELPGIQEVSIEYRPVGEPVDEEAAWNEIKKRHLGDREGIQAELEFALSQGKLEEAQKAMAKLASCKEATPELLSIMKEELDQIKIWNASLEALSFRTTRDLLIPHGDQQIPVQLLLDEYKAKVSWAKSAQEKIERYLQNTRTEINLGLSKAEEEWNGGEGEENPFSCRVSPTGELVSKASPSKGRGSTRSWQAKLAEKMDIYKASWAIKLHDSGTMTVAVPLEGGYRVGKLDSAGQLVVPSNGEIFSTLNKAWSSLKLASKSMNVKTLQVLVNVPALEGWSQPLKGWSSKRIDSILAEA